MLSYLEPYKTGPWYDGRSRKRRQPDGTVAQEHIHARYLRLEDVLHTVQIDTNGELYPVASGKTSVKYLMATSR